LAAASSACVVSLVLSRACTVVRASPGFDGDLRGARRPLGGSVAGGFGGLRHGVLLARTMEGL
jgi:hypothetical protein